MPQNRHRLLRNQQRRALAAAPLLLLTMKNAGSIPAAIALYVTSLIFYGYGTAITIYAEDLAAPLKQHRTNPAVDTPKKQETKQDEPSQTTGR